MSVFCTCSDCVRSGAPLMITGLDKKAVTRPIKGDLSYMQKKLIRRAEVRAKNLTRRRA